jgi:N-acetylneuraminic acid mutarotase
MGRGEQVRARARFDRGVLAGVAVLWLASARADSPAPDSWTATGKLAYAHTIGAAAVFKDPSSRTKVLMVGGSTTNGTDLTIFSPYAEVYDPSTNAWSSFPAPGAPPPLVPARGTGVNVVTLADGNVLVLGGRAVTNDCVLTPSDSLLSLGYFTNRCDLYRPATNDWQRTGDLPMAYSNIGTGAVVLADGRVLLCGGVGGESFIIANANNGNSSVRWTATKHCLALSMDL